MKIQSWDFRSGSASSTSRNPLSNPDTNDRHLKYDRWGYKEVEVKRREEDEFAEKLRKHHQHPLWRKCYICELQGTQTWISAGIAFVTCAIDQSAVPTLQKLLHRYIRQRDLVVLTR
eukprot:5557458-Amphidinium_carterae.1